MREYSETICRNIFVKENVGGEKMFIGLLVLVTIVSGVGVLLSKYMDNWVGSGLGMKNNERWGIDERKKDK